MAPSVAGNQSHPDTGSRTQESIMQQSWRINPGWRGELRPPNPEQRKGMRCPVQRHPLHKRASKRHCSFRAYPYVYPQHGRRGIRPHKQTLSYKLHDRRMDRKAICIGIVAALPKLVRKPFGKEQGDRGLEEMTHVQRLLSSTSSNDENTHSEPESKHEHDEEDER